MHKSWNAKSHALRYAIGLDIGQQVDFSALAVVGHFATQGPFDPESETFLPEWQSHVKWLERCPLQTAFSSVVNRAVAIRNDPVLASGGDDSRGIPPRPPPVVIDSTGVGLPLIELFQKNHGVKVVPVCITGGSIVNQNAAGYRVPKQDLIAALSVEFELARIKIASGLDLADDLLGELRNFRMETSAATGRSTFNAAVGHHDDLLISCALAVWWLQSQRGRAAGLMKITFG